MDSPVEPNRTSRRPIPRTALKTFVFTLVITIGSLVLIDGLLSLAHEAKPKAPAVEFRHGTRYEENSFSDGASYGGVLVRPPTELSVQLVLSAAAIATCVLLSLRRFSLRILLGIVILIGLLGALPALLIPKPSSGIHAVFSVAFPGQLEETRIERIRSQLIPTRALATLPDGMLEELHLPRGHGLQSVELLEEKDTSDAAKLVCKIRFSDGMETDQREALASFMDTWFRRLLLAEARQQGMTFMKGSQVNTNEFGTVWPKWEQEWEEGLK